MTGHGAESLALSAGAPTPAGEAASVEARLERLEREREFLLLHSRNLERQLYRLARRRAQGDSGRTSALAIQARELEARLVELTRAHVAVVTSRTWRALAPYRALRLWVQRRLRR